MSTLEIKNLNVEIAGKAILKDFSLTIPKGEVHAIMGPNGTGKSTLAKAMAGHEDYEITSGEVLLDGENIVGKEAG
jgi:Fe-S cluster assembly ATP-binding protein